MLEIRKEVVTVQSGSAEIEYLVYISGWGYYGGPNHKYWDMWNITSYEFAKRLTIKEAERVKDWLVSGGYDVEIREDSMTMTLKRAKSLLEHYGIVRYPAIMNLVHRKWKRSMVFWLR